MRVNLRTTLSLALALGLRSACGLAAQAPIEGTFVLMAEGSESIEQAIERAVAPMNLVARPIARSRLRETNPQYRTVSIGSGAGQVRVSLDERAPVVAPSSGEPVPWTREDGQRFQVSARWSGNTLEQSFVAGDGRRVNRYTLDAGGDTLTLHVTLSSPRLPEPVTYRLRYRRRG